MEQLEFLEGWESANRKTFHWRVGGGLWIFYVTTHFFWFVYFACIFAHLCSPQLCKSIVLQVKPIHHLCVTLILMVKHSPPSKQQQQKWQLHAVALASQVGCNRKDEVTITACQSCNDNCASLLQVRSRLVHVDSAKFIVKLIN